MTTTTQELERQRDIAMVVAADALRELDRILDTGDTYASREIVQNLKNFIHTGIPTPDPHCGWSPIATAPKDGTVILTDAGSCAWADADVENNEGLILAEGWYLCGPGEKPARGDEFSESYPTHWREFPAAPQV